jgi:hypothetical protein
VDKKSDKEMLDRMIQEKTRELERFRNMEALLLADIASFEKQKLDVDKEIAEPVEVEK